MLLNKELKKVFLLWVNYYICIMEIYKDVPNYEGIYRVSNYGNVQSKRTKNEWKQIGKRNPKEYVNITLRDGFKIETFKLHRLVISLFKEKVHNKNFVNHIDKDPSNNHIDNLEWVDNRENMSHSFSLKNKTSKYVGVCWKSRESKWSAEVYINKKRYFLGLFETEELAANAYNNKLLEFGITNKYK